MQRMLKILDTWRYAKMYSIFPLWYATTEVMHDSALCPLPSNSCIAVYRFNCLISFSLNCPEFYFSLDNLLECFAVVYSYFLFSF